MLDDAVRWVGERLVTDGSITLSRPTRRTERESRLPRRWIFPATRRDRRRGNRVRDQFQLDAFGEALLLFAPRRPGPARRVRLGCRSCRRSWHRAALDRARRRDLGGRAAALDAQQARSASLAFVPSVRPVHLRAGRRGTSRSPTSWPRGRRGPRCTHRDAGSAARRTTDRRVVAPRRGARSGAARRPPQRPDEAGRPRPADRRRLRVPLRRMRPPARRRRGSLPDLQLLAVSRLPRSGRPARGTLAGSIGRARQPGPLDSSQRSSTFSSTSFAATCPRPSSTPCSSSAPASSHRGETPRQPARTNGEPHRHRRHLSSLRGANRSSRGGRDP